MQQKKKLLFTGGSGLLALNWAMQLIYRRFRFAGIELGHAAGG
jgi:hypothetical protein